MILNDNVFYIQGFEISSIEVRLNLINFFQIKEVKQLINCKQILLSSDLARHIVKILDMSGGVLIIFSGLLGQPAYLFTKLLSRMLKIDNKLLL